MEAVERIMRGLQSSSALLTLGMMAAVLVAVLAAAAAIRTMVSGRDEVVERLARTVGRADGYVPPSRTRFRVGRLFEPLGWIARPSKAAELSRLRALLVQAGYRAGHALETFLALKAGTAIVITVAFLYVYGETGGRSLLSMPAMAAALFVCGVGFLMPNFWLSVRRRGRQTQIERALPDALDLLVTCVEAGLGMDAAVARVSEEIGLASPIVGGELNLTFLEIQAGLQRAEAFRRLAERTGVEDLRALSAMLIQTEMFGTSVARALRAHADGMRIRRTQRAEERAAMVGVYMTLPLILCILPALVAILVGPAITAMLANFIVRR